MDQTILEVQDLRIHFELREGTVKALNGIDLVLKEGRTLGLVGETGLPSWPRGAPWRCAAGC